jgi:bifunctional DNA-binding transcriptional regulator/antitoxin component of YhaV-PrlF toxin-antitoxin module
MNMSKKTFMGELGSIGYKKITVTGKRQITIPKNFFDHLGIGTAVAAYLREGGIFLKPIRDEKETIAEIDTREIVHQAIAEGLTGDELADEIARRVGELNKLLDRRIQEFESDLTDDSVDDGEVDDYHGLHIFFDQEIGEDAEETRE